MRILRMLVYITPFAILIGGGSGCGTADLRDDARARSDYFYSDGVKHPVDVRVDALGVVAREGISPKALEEFVGRRGLRVFQTYHRNIYLLAGPKSRDRMEAVGLARALEREGAGIIEHAGFLAKPANAEIPLIVTDEFIALLERGADLGALKKMNAANGVEVVRTDPFVAGQYLLRVTERSQVDALTMANRYHESDVVKFAHPNFVRVVIRRQLIPNDRLFADQWHHQNTGQGAGTVDADVDTPLGWALTRGNAQVLIAVIDDAVEITHADLAPNRWTNPGETAGDGIDNDGNGFVDDVNGWDFSGDDGNPAPGAGDDHGTAVAGVAVARGNNTTGVAGACQECGMLAIRYGSTMQDDADAFGYAEAVGADVITNSWGYAIGTPTTTVVSNAITSAATNGRGGLGSVVLFAMNNGNINDCTGATPDISSHASVIAVSAASNQDRKVTESAFGNCMDVLSPTHRGYGGATAYTGTLNIVTTDRAGATGYNNTSLSAACPSVEPATPPADARDYTYCFGGTSSATPLGGGVAGLILSAEPTLTRLQVQQLLQDTTDRIQDSAGTYANAVGFSAPASGNASHGWGRINAFEAIRVAAPTAAGGRGGVDVLIRDNRLDWGNTEQPSNVLFEPTRGFIPHYVSVDIKVDGPPYQPVPATPAAFEALTHEDAVTGQPNRAYVRVRNRGPVVAATTSVKLHWADAGPGLPALPGDFWSAFPGDSASTAVWHPMPCSANPAGTVCTVSNLAYSGASAAGCPGRTQPPCGPNDAAQVVQFDFQGPAIGASGVNHFCLLAVLDSPQDRPAPLSRPTVAADFIPDLLTPRDNNVTHRNIKVQGTGRSSSFEERFRINNPFDKDARVVLSIDGPKGWEFTANVPLREPLQLGPYESRLVRMVVKAPGLGGAGTIDVRQQTTSGREIVIGGIEYRYEPEQKREQ